MASTCTDSQDAGTDPADKDTIDRRLDHLCFDDEGVVTHTSSQQAECEAVCAALLGADEEEGVEPPTGSLLWHAHFAYLTRGLGNLPSSWSSMDASRTWIVYWCLTGLDTLGVVHATMEAMHARVIAFVRSCAAPGGGYGGGPGQAAHTAATFAATMALLTIGTREAYDAIDRAGLHEFYTRMKQAPLPEGEVVDASRPPYSGTVHPGGFTVQDGGECDVRGTYTALAVASITGILTPALVVGAEEYLASCQSYEGGFGGEPGNEAHGGYTYCALAGLRVLSESQGGSGTQGSPLASIDSGSLRRWLVGRQLPLEGGFAGRTNKLVDACYSFWQAACLPMLPGQELCSPVLAQSWAASGGFDRMRLQEYLLRCCQDASGGLWDKPGKSRDYYHTCYALAGLSVSQYDYSGVAAVPGCAALRETAGVVVQPVHPVYGIGWECVRAARAHFSTLPPLSEVSSESSPA